MFKLDVIFLTAYKTDKPFKTIEEQIKILSEQRNLQITSIESARIALSRYGYYEIINGYKDNFMIDPSNDNMGFKPNTTFDHIYNLFELDQRLRSGVISALELFEANLRQVLAYTISSQISEFHELYIKRHRYNTGKKFHNNRLNKDIYPIDNLLMVLKKTVSSHEQPFTHYREKHDNIPPWIIVKRLSLGNLIWWVRLLKKPEKDMVISKMLGLPLVMLKNDKIFHDFFGEVLALCLNYRNTAAHGGRIYNHRSQKYKLVYKESIHPIIFNISASDYYKHQKGQSSLGVLLTCLDMFENKSPYLNLRAVIIVALDKYLKNYPEDQAFLFEKMELDPALSKL